MRYKEGTIEEDNNYEYQYEEKDEETDEEMDPAGGAVSH